MSDRIMNSGYTNIVENNSVRIRQQGRKSDNLKPVENPWKVILSLCLGKVMGL